MNLQLVENYALRNKYLTFNHIVQHSYSSVQVKLALMHLEWPLQAVLEAQWISPLEVS